jgi:uncharacterized membrane protein YjjP (DUF1212 family)
MVGAGGGIAAGDGTMAGMAGGTVAGMAGGTVVGMAGGIVVGVADGIVAFTAGKSRSRPLACAQMTVRSASSSLSRRGVNPKAAARAAKPGLPWWRPLRACRRS